MAPISIISIAIALLGCICGAAAGVLAISKHYFLFVVVSLDLEFASSLLSALAPAGFFIPLGIPTVILSIFGLLLTFSHKNEFYSILEEAANYPAPELETEGYTQ